MAVALLDSDAGFQQDKGRTCNDVWRGNNRNGPAFLTATYRFRTTNGLTVPLRQGAAEITL